MDAVKFVKEKFRMCELVERCSNCPINFGDCTISPKSIERMVPVVEKWSAEHPPKTILQDFLEKYPNAPFIDGVPEEICPHHIGYSNLENCIFGVTCEECWNRPLEE